MIKITSVDSDSFSIIKNALDILDPSGEFLNYFKVAEQSDKDKDGVTVILRNSKKFSKDLNKRKYVVLVPETLKIDSFEFVKTFEGPGRARHPEYNVVIKATVEGSEVNFVIILSGFVSDSIRIVKNPDVLDVPSDDNEEEVDLNTDKLADAIDDTITE